jgi:hypothetical protein
MTYAALMNWEICLDAAGIFCCILSVLYLIRLKRKAEMNSRIPGPIQREDAGPFKATPIGMPEDMSFDGVLASVTHDSRMAVDEGRGGRGTAADPYDEVRRLLNLGMATHQIAERIKIPRCELDLIVSLHKIQPETVSDTPGEKEYSAALA